MLSSMIYACLLLVHSLPFASGDFPAHYKESGPVILLSLFQYIFDHVVI